VQHIKGEVGGKVEDYSGSSEGVRGNLMWPISIAQAIRKFSIVLQPALQEVAAAAAAAAAAGPTAEGQPAADTAAGEDGENASSSSSSSSSYEQVRASTVFLSVLLSLGIVELHEAAVWLPSDVTAQGQMGLANYIFEQQYMQGVLKVFSDLQATLQLCSLGLHAAAAEGSCTSTAAAAAAAEDRQLGKTSSSSSQAVRWQYLLRLHESRKLANAVAAFNQNSSTDAITALLQLQHVEQEARRYSTAEEFKAAMPAYTEKLRQLWQLYQDALGFCRTLTAVVPLPVVCNNPGCVELRGVSEAAAARHVCAGCGCRYCSAACQAAGWRSHKKACRRMAACGMRVEGQRQPALLTANRIETISKHHLDILVAVYHVYELSVEGVLCACGL
jgi:hypothetical protein